MCLSQQDILLLAILHGAPVLTAHSDQSPTYTDSRVNLRLQALMDRAASLLPVIIGVNVWSSR